MREGHAMGRGGRFDLGRHGLPVFLAVGAIANHRRDADRLRLREIRCVDLRRDVKIRGDLLDGHGLAPRGKGVRQGMSA